MCFGAFFGTFKQIDAAKVGEGRVLLEVHHSNAMVHQARLAKAWWTCASNHALPNCMKRKKVIFPAQHVALNLMTYWES